MKLFSRLVLLLVLSLLPVRGLCFDKGQVAVFTPEKIYSLDVRLAKTPEEWRQGLLDSGDLKEDQGLFFIFPREGVYTFTTKGLKFPIDIILINKETRIVGIFEYAAGDKYYAFPLPVFTALEVRAGFCRKKGIKIGDLVKPKGFGLRPGATARPKQEEKKGVEKRLKENLERHPDDPMVYEELAVFYTLSGQDKKAVEIFKEVLKLGITAPRLNGLGVALAKLGDLEKAEKYFKKAIKEAPLFYGSYNNLARLYLQREELSEATALFQEAITLYPHYLEAYMGLTGLYLRTGDLRAAEILIKEAKENGLNAPEIIRLSGNIYLRQGRYENAANCYLEYLKARPHDEQATDLRAFILVHKIRPRQISP
ncbi:MAG: hypothetical protein C4B58_11345 [Deltaproteobacteria bacterium]|nr:MAG: hypothetical protein C4B58_11345 [Deltaproteobacteria bacterium]